MRNLSKVKKDKDKEEQIKKDHANPPPNIKWIVPDHTTNKELQDINQHLAWYPNIPAN